MTTSTSEVPTNADFDLVSSIQLGTSSQVPYTPTSWQDVHFLDNTSAKSSFWIPHLIITYGNRDPPLEAAQTLASLTTVLPNGGQFPTTKLPAGIHVDPPGEPQPWSDQPIKDLFYPPPGEATTEDPPAPVAQAVDLGSLISAYEGAPTPSMPGMRVSLDQFNHTTFAFLYLLPRFYKKPGDRMNYIQELVNRINRINGDVNPTFLAYLLSEFSKQPRWGLFMDEGGLISVNVSLCGLILFNEPTITPVLKAELSFSLLGVIFHAFTAYQLLLQVAQLDRKKPGEVLKRIPTQSSDTMTKNIVSRAQDLANKPCWYAIAPICNPAVEAEFSISKNTALVKTLTLIISWLDPSQKSNLDRLVLKMSAQAIQEGIFGYKCYRKCSELDIATATRPVVVRGVEVSFANINASSLQQSSAGTDQDHDSDAGDPGATAQALVQFYNNSL
ncbi:TPA_asm: hypothetical protein [Sphaeridiorhabdovirus 1]|nr:TPA_asm: hypothetical protein [Sphaeridiorhabdovirus 1]